MSGSNRTQGRRSNRDQNRRKGALVLSLDFELLWGVRDKRSIETYGENLRGVRRVVPGLLKLFDTYGIHATWATVGLLFCRGRDEMMASLPPATLQPQYDDMNLSPYPTIDQAGADETEDPYHFAPSLIREILAHPNQTIGSHTFSHYYCLEKGQTAASFEADCEAFSRVAAAYGLKPTSIVLPRNQFNREYVGVCKKAGITAIRGNMDHWLYSEKTEEEETTLRRALRYGDAFISLSGPRVFPLAAIDPVVPVTIPATRFLYPHKSFTAAFDWLRLLRIKNEMTYAARFGFVYHLWWHPHNFGKDYEVNIAFLEKILQHFHALHKRYGMESLSIEEVATRVIEGKI